MAKSRHLDVPVSVKRMIQYSKSYQCQKDMPVQQLGPHVNLALSPGLQSFGVQHHLLHSLSHKKCSRSLLCPLAKF